MKRGRRLVVLGAVLVVAAGCSPGSGSAATILVDYEHDSFATQFIKYFPDQVQVHPGDTIAFRQQWTGEPHTVTLGTVVDEVLDVTRPLIEEYGDRPEEEVPRKVLKTFMKAEMNLPLLYEGPPGSGGEEEGGDIPQSMAQRCLIEPGGSLPDGDRPCEEQELGAFDGTQAYYNSGIIPFEGPGGNVFDLELADSIEPGKYNFVCSVHGSFHSGTIEVLPEDEPIPPPDEVNAETREQVNQEVRPFESVFAQAQEGRFVLEGETHTGNFAGLVHDDVEGLLNEFVPETIETSVDEPVTWRMFGPHSISFDVPEYFPIYEFLEDGTVRYNEDLEPPAGGAPDIPKRKNPSKPLVIDGGTYDGSGFWSSGLLFSDSYSEYTLRFSEPGTYRYACLIHPPMVGTVVVGD